MYRKIKTKNIMMGKKELFIQFLLQLPVQLLALLLQLPELLPLELLSRP
jgi:hypothetical protein